MLGKIKYKSISEIGVKEKYLRANHYNSIKVWWARRPITTSRALLIKEVMKRKNDDNADVDIDLYTNINPTLSSLKEFGEKYNTNNINVLDVFAGGGAIPFESSRLGFKTFSSELNPVASLLQETIFKSQSIDDYPEKLRVAGYNIIDRVEQRLGKFYNINGTIPYVLFWSKVAKCKTCNSPLNLRRLEYLSKRTNKPVRILETANGLIIDRSLGKEENLQKEFTCKECNTQHTFKDIKDFCIKNSFSFSPFAHCYHSSKKDYKIISPEDSEVLKSYDVLINEEINKLRKLIPDEDVKSKSGVINPTIYDLKKVKDFFSNRQLLVLLAVIDEIIKEYPDLLRKYGDFQAKQVVMGLTSLVEFLVDWNSLSTMWISQNEQTGRSLAGPGVGMKWDFIEVNPFYRNGSNLKSKIDRVCNTFQAISSKNDVTILKGTSTNLAIDDKTIDIVLTDPPYYDSIDYTGLSEFFRPWFETIIKNTYDHEINLKNENEYEAIVSLGKGDNYKDHNHYKNIMTGVLLEVSRVLKDDGTILLMYSHKTIEGWKVIAEAFRDSKLFISDCIPLEMERSARPRAMAYEALNGVIVFRATKNLINSPSVQDDINSIKEKIEIGDMLESQIVIYLAALACKKVTNTNVVFEDAYYEVTKLYQLTLIERWLRDEMDEITIAYLEARLNSLNQLDPKYLELIKSNELLKDGNIKNMDEIDNIDIYNHTLLNEALIIYNDFKKNSKTKLSLNEKKNSLTAFFSILAGTQLNTVSKRSSNTEVKTSRLILSKIT